MRVVEVWECPLCGRQTAGLATEAPAPRPYICDLGHDEVEMEQRLPDAFDAERQGQQPTGASERTLPQEDSHG